MGSHLPEMGVRWGERKLQIMFKVLIVQGSKFTSSEKKSNKTLNQIFKTENSKMDFRFFVWSFLTFVFDIYLSA